jgi:hypothetical protein
MKGIIDIVVTTRLLEVSVLVRTDDLKILDVKLRLLLACRSEHVIPNGQGESVVCSFVRVETAET